MSRYLIGNKIQCDHYVQYVHYGHIEHDFKAFWYAFVRFEHDSRLFGTFLILVYNMNISVIVYVIVSFLKYLDRIF